MSLEDGLESARKVIAEIAWNRLAGIDVPDVGTASGTRLPAAMHSDAAALGTWLGANSVEVCLSYHADKKIVAIKEARVIAGVGLKDAKYAIDWLWERPELLTAASPAIPPF